MSTRLWDRAAAVPVVAGRPTAEVVALPAGLPSVEDLFAFARDAELRFATLRMRIEERAFTARGEQLTTMDVAIRHPGSARVATAEPGRGVAGSHELWISDGEVVRTYSAIHRLGTERPVRNRPRGLSRLPGASQVYEPLTALPAETLADLFVHPAGYCQNVLATGECWVSGTESVAGREAIVVECRHPRAVERMADRPDFRIQVAFDRAAGTLSRVVETIAGDVTRIAEIVALETDAALPPSIFDFEFPEGTTHIY